MPIVGMIAANLLVTLVSIALFRVVRSKIAYLDVPIFGLIWIFVATFCALVLGLFGFLRGTAITAISAAGLLACAAIYGRNLKRFRLGSFRRPHISVRPSLLGVVLCILAIIQIVRIAVHFWYIPPYVWDTLLYHLVNVAEWIQKGRIFPASTPVERVYWPANFEVLEAWFAVFLHNDLLVKIPSVLYYAMSGACAYAIARALRLNARLSSVVAIFYLFTPSLAIQATACKNDIAIAALYLLSVAVLLDPGINGKRQEFPLAGRLLIVAMALGLGVGTKPYIAFMAPGLLLLGIFTVWKARGDSRQPAEKESRGWRRCREWALSRGRVYCCTAVLLAAASVFLASYWYVRNYAVFRNPFYPTNFTVGDIVISGKMQPEQFGPAQRGSPSARGLLSNLYSAATVRIFDRHPYSSHLHNTSGWGWFSFACGLCACLHAVIFVKRLRILVLCFVVSFVGLLSLVSTDPWFMRFTLWVPSLFAVSFGMLISHLSLKWLRAALLGFAVLCTSLNLAGVLNRSEITADDTRKMMRLPAGDRKTSGLSRYAGGGYAEALAVVPKDAILGFCFPNNGCGYPLYDNDFSRHLAYIPIEDSRFSETMKAEGARFLFTERLSPMQTRMVQDAVRSNRLARIRSNLYALQ